MRPIVLTQTNAGTTQAAPLDIHGRPEISLQVNVVSGTPTYTVQQTVENVFDPTITPVWLDHPDTNLVAQTVNRQGNYAFVPSAVRLVVTGTGAARLTIVQAGILG